MFWSTERQYCIWPFEQETELERAVRDAQSDLFGDARAYLDVRTLLGASAKDVQAPDAFLIDLSSRYLPTLYLVEIELASHDPLRHVAQQLLAFDLSVRSSPQRLRDTLRQVVQKSPTALGDCEAYAVENGYTSLDHLLDELVHPDALRALVVVDALDDDFEHALRDTLKLPIEVLSFRRFRSTSGGDVLYDFEPFMNDLLVAARDASRDPAEPAIDPAELDTIIVPARKEGFNQLFLHEHMWRPVRIHESLLPRIRYIAGYQSAPISAITHVAEVERIEPFDGPGNYAVYFKGPAQEVGPIYPVPNGGSSPPTGNRYTSFARLCRAHTLEEVF
jgi:hypothetical protein